MHNELKSQGIVTEDDLFVIFGTLNGFSLSFSSLSIPSCLFPWPSLTSLLEMTTTSKKARSKLSTIFQKVFIFIFILFCYLIFFSIFRMKQFQRQHFILLLKTLRAGLI